MQIQEARTSPSPLGETLRSARLARGVTFEEAERITRIPRKYLEALEQENYGILPAPVYARGFLRSYAGYLGLDAAQLLPFFPVGHVEEPKLDPLPEVKQPRTMSTSGVIGVAAVGALVLLVIGLYSLGSNGGGNAFIDEEPASGNAPEVVVPSGGEAPGGAGVGPAFALPDLAGLTLEEAIGKVEEAGASYVVVGVREGDVPVGQVVNQSPPPNTQLEPGDLVTLVVSR